MRLLSLDIETTGLDPEQDQILEVGMVYQDNDLNREVFQTYVKHPRYNGSAYALAMNSEILKEIATREKQDLLKHNDICLIDDLAEKMSKWLHSIMNKYGISKFVITGKNVGSFDLNFLRKIPEWSSFPLKYWFHHRVLDIGPMFARPTDEVPPNLKECLKRAGLPDMVSHRAVYDANVVLDCINAVWG